MRPGNERNSVDNQDEEDLLREGDVYHSRFVAREHDKNEQQIKQTIILRAVFGDIVGSAYEWDNVKTKVRIITYRRADG